MASLQPMTPPALDRVVRRCLAKEPDERWQSANDLANEVKWIAEGGSQVSSLPIASAKGIRTRGRGALLWGGASLLLAAIIGLAVWNLKPSLPQPISRFTITLPPGQQLAGLENGPAVALSPDGTHLAHVSRQGGAQKLYLRVMDSLEPTPVPGTEGAFCPFFSPDGLWMGFFAGGALKKVSIGGGAAVTLGVASIPGGASWGSHGIIGFAPTQIGFLQEV